VPVDPAPHRHRIDIPQCLRSHRAGDRAAVDIRHPGGVKTETRALRDAKTVRRDQPKHQRAGRQAIAVDDDALAGRAQRGEDLQVMTDLTAAILGDAHGGGGGRNTARQQSGTEQQAPNTHQPRPGYRRTVFTTVSLTRFNHDCRLEMRALERNG